MKTSKDYSHGATLCVSCRTDTIPVQDFPERDGKLEWSLDGLTVHWAHCTLRSCRIQSTRVASIVAWNLGLCTRLERSVSEFCLISPDSCSSLVICNRSIQYSSSVPSLVCGLCC